MLTRRAAFAAVGAFALTPLAALAQGSAPIRAIQVDVSALRTDMGEYTANWVAESLPPALAAALGAAYQPQARNGALLIARIDRVYLGPAIPAGFGSPQDTIEGALILVSARGKAPVVIPLRASASYIQTSVDVAFPVEANRDRVVTLARSFAHWAPGQLGL